jgi:ribosomal protein S18 acetylase RimI-like enzyme
VAVPKPLPLACSLASDIAASHHTTLRQLSRHAPSDITDPRVAAKLWVIGRFHFAKRRLFLQQLCVDGDHRRHGVASALMDHAARLARENSVEEIALDTWSANGTAQSFFHARGFEPYMALMRKPSGEAAGGA